MSEFKFSCPGCGQHLAATEAWSGKQIQCPACQKTLVVPAAPVAAPVAAPAVRLAGTAAPVASAVPSAGPPPPPPPPPGRPSIAPPMPRTPAPMPRPQPQAAGGTSGLAIASLCLGLGIFILGIFSAIPAIICGHMALGRIKSGRAAGGKGMALAGVILGYVCVVITAVALVFIVGAVRKAQQQFANNPPPTWTTPTQTRPTPGQPMRVTPQRGGRIVNNNNANFRPMPERNDPKVETDPATVVIPATRVSGTLGKANFALGKASLQGSIFHLQHGTNFIADREVIIFLKNGEKFAGQTYTITPDTGFDSPHVHFRWKEGEEPKSDALTGGYVMRLEFAQPAGKKLPGKIYLELPQSYGTKLAGTFTADLN